MWGRAGGLVRWGWPVGWWVIFTLRALGWIGGEWRTLVFWFWAGTVVVYRLSSRWSLVWAAVAVGGAGVALALSRQGGGLRLLTYAFMFLAVGVASYVAESFKQNE